MIRNLKRWIKKFVQLAGYDIRRHATIRLPGKDNLAYCYDTPDQAKVQYACGPKFLKEWVNVDCYSPDMMKKRYGMTDEYLYYQADLGYRQPFNDNAFAYAFAEDFIEHLCQADSIIFLNECYRVLAEGGVLRLSFPGFAGVLKKHFSSSEYADLLTGRKDAYDRYAHLHFYSREELLLLAEHIGFADISFREFGRSDHEVLRNLETREQQQDLNIYVELTK